MAFRNPYLERLQEFPDQIVRSPILNRGRWSAVFGRNAPKFIDIGSDHGHFLLALAECHPEYDYIGIEKSLKPTFKAAEKSARKQLSNVRFIAGRAEQIVQIFSPGELAGAFILFPDPWPKKRHLRRRLINPDFTGQLRTLLEPGAEIVIKTDHFDYFRVIGKAFRASGFDKADFADDLPRSGFEHTFRNKAIHIFVSAFQKPHRSHCLDYRRPNARTDTATKSINGPGTTPSTNVPIPVNTSTTPIDGDGSAETT